MKRYIFLVAAVALATVSCSKTYDTNRNAGEGLPISLGTWADVMTKAPIEGFQNNDEFDVFGFKWNSGPADQANVFTGDDVKYNSSTSTWSYTPIRFWDTNFDNYTFFAAFPKNQLEDPADMDDYAQSGYFESKAQSYDGKNEVLLVAQKKTVPNASFGASVVLVFKHTGALVDIKFKKHTDIESAKVEVTSIALTDISTDGSFAVASYDGSDNPVGATVSGVAGLGWTPASPAVYNETDPASAAAAPYLNDSGVALAKNGGVGTANAAALISNLVVMPQVLGKTSGPKITISYQITTDPGGANEEVLTFSDKPIFFGEFDKSDPDPSDKDNTDPRIANWMPGVHYTYYITINAKAIEFSASVADWSTADATGHYYLAY